MLGASRWNRRKRSPSWIPVLDSIETAVRKFAGATRLGACVRVCLGATNRADVYSYTHIGLAIIPRSSNLENLQLQSTALVPLAIVRSAATSHKDYQGSGELNRPAVMSSRKGSFGPRTRGYFLLKQVLPDSDLRFSEIANSVDLIVLKLDAQGNVSFCNDFLLNLIGWKKEELLGRNWCDQCVPRDQYAAQVFKSQMDSGSVPSTHENHIITRYATRRLIAWENQTLFDFSGAPIGVASIGDDITDIALFGAETFAPKIEPHSDPNDLDRTIHAHDDDLELYVKGRLEPGRASSLEFHLGQCESCRERLSNSIGLAMVFSQPDTGNRRVEPRFETGDAATLRELSPLSLTREKVTIVDVSKSGMGIVSRRPLLPGSIVQLRVKDSFELAEVRYCIEWSNNQYRIGLRLPAD